MKAREMAGKKGFRYVVAGITAWVIVQEIPAIVRYYKTKRQ